MTLLLLLAVLLVAYANGANDNFKPVATLYGSGTLSYRTALILATAAQIAGSLASVILAGALLGAFGGKGLVPDATVADPAFLIAVAGAAALTVLIATRLGMPISTTHALLGGLSGAGLALAPSAFAWGGLGPGYVTPLLVSPVLAVAGAGAFYPVLRAVRKRAGLEPETCLCIGRGVGPASITADGAVIARDGDVRVAVGTAVDCRTVYAGRVLGVSAQRVVDGLHVGSGLALAFARGLNDTPKVMALLVAAAWTGLPPSGALAVIALAMAVGGLLHARRIARTMGLRITEMNPGQGLLANVVASGLVIGASGLGLPVSTTHVSNGAIFGIGLWTGRTRWRVVGEIVLSWIVTLPLAAGLAYGLAIAVG